MKKIILFVLLISFSISFAQKTKPNYSKLTTLSMVKLTLDGLDLENKIYQDSIIPIKKLKLVGTDSENFSIISYHFKTNYKRSLTEDDFFDSEIPKTMTQFFKDLESNCKISFEEIVIKHKENGKLFKILPLSVFIKI